MPKVNEEKWEEIDFSQIEKGDKIRCITVQGKVVSDTRGVVNSVAYGVNSHEGVTFISDPSRFSPIAGGHRTIYRRKPKAFEYPTALASVIRVKAEYSDVKFVRSEAGWHHAGTGTLYYDGEIETYFPKAEITVERVGSGS